MGTKISVRRVTNANIRVNGASWMGRAEEVTLPELKSTQQEHKGLGLQGRTEFPAGFDKMEMKIKWSNAYDVDVMKIAHDHFAAVNLEIRGAVDVYTGAGRTGMGKAIISVQGRFKGTTGGGFKQHESVDTESMLAVTYMKQVIDDIEVLEVDLINNIYRVNGVDLLAETRQILGE